MFQFGQPGIWSISTSNWLIFKRFPNPPTNDVLIESTILLKMKTVFCWIQKHYFIAHVSVMIIYRIISFKVTRLTRINAICMASVWTCWKQLNRSSIKNHSISIQQKKRFYGPKMLIGFKPANNSVKWLWSIQWLWKDSFFQQNSTHEKCSSHQRIFWRFFMKIRRYIETKFIRFGGMHSITSFYCSVAAEISSFPNQETIKSDIKIYLMWQFISGK